MRPWKKSGFAPRWSMPAGQKGAGPQNDTSDAEWLAMLARVGLCAAVSSAGAARTLREVSRHHRKLTAMRAMEKNRLVKVLSDAGIRISAVVSDPHGVAPALSSTACWTAVRRTGARPWPVGSKPARGLIGRAAGELSPDHLFVAQTIRHHLRALEAQLTDLERYLVDALQPQEAALQLLMTIPGIDRLAAAKLLVEIGVDMAAFGNAGRLCKWAGVCPGNDESAGIGGEAIPRRAIVTSAPCCAKSPGPRYAPPVSLRAVSRTWSVVGGPSGPSSPSAIKCSRRCSCCYRARCLITI